MSTQVVKNTGKTSATDGAGLAWRSWSPESPRGVVVVVHGLADEGHPGLPQFILGHSMGGLVELVEWPGLYHEMFHELEKDPGSSPG